MGRKAVAVPHIPDVNIGGARLAEAPHITQKDCTSKLYKILKSEKFAT